MLHAFDPLVQQCMQHFLVGYAKVFVNFGADNGRNCAGNTRPRMLEDVIMRNVAIEKRLSTSTMTNYNLSKIYPIYNSFLCEFCLRLNASKSNQRKYAKSFQFVSSSELSFK